MKFQGLKKSTIPCYSCTSLFCSVQCSYKLFKNHLPWTHTQARILSDIPTSLHLYIWIIYSKNLTNIYAHNINLRALKCCFLTYTWCSIAWLVTVKTLNNKTIHLKSLFQTHTVGRSRHNIFYKPIMKMATTGLQNIGYN